jgi:hypothetical protein
MRWSVIAVAVLLGCAREVPIEVKQPLPEAPAECFMPMEHVRPMRPISAQMCGPTPIAVCASTVWAKHVLERQAAARRAEARRRICETYIKRIQG